MITIAGLIAQNDQDKSLILAAPAGIGVPVTTRAYCSMVVTRWPLDAEVAKHDCVINLVLFTMHATDIKSVIRSWKNEWLTAASSSFFAPVVTCQPMRLQATFSTKSVGLLVRLAHHKKSSQALSRTKWQDIDIAAKDFIGGTNQTSPRRAMLFSPTPTEIQPKQAVVQPSLGGDHHSYTEHKVGGTHVRPVTLTRVR
ncbi:saccharopine dehydrogenase (NADP+, L-glutamate-forming) [Conoideocrella luteorostrata]|uniref:Saccharopine dehydrogenase (NADP+, L-glutamate-forming) n=1 Tax=Conoideocrella luteorostrata TaxID=1105319 RepID=A0AAJ0FVJ0_9HYPO|nr:saccharopine dehydrogenase (NADP+, L-glutamate-forming) [Conoideocrella luteorostrata]